MNVYGRMGRAVLCGACVAGLGWMVGCRTVPDEQKMRELRGQAAEERLHELAEKLPAEGSVYVSGALKLSDAVEKAIEKNLSLKQARQAREIARGRIQASYTEALPSLDLTGGYTRLDDDLATLQNGVETRGRFQDQTFVGLRVTQPLFNGRIGAALRAAQLYATWAEMGIRQAQEDVVYAVIVAYYNAILSAHLLDVNLAALETAEGQLSDVRARRRQGMASNYDELRAEVEVSNFKAEVLGAQNEKDLAYTTLFRLIGASPESEVELTDAIPLVMEDITFEAAARLALERRADLAEAEYAVRMQRESVAVVKSRYLPEISGFVSQEWASPDPHNSRSSDWGDEWMAGVQVSLPIFDGLGRRGQLIEERAKLEQLELGLRDTEEKVISQIRQLVLSLKTAEEFANSQSQNLKTAK
ncbi:MAG: TolC family protein, partial [Verrucomicrobiota bacterium]|nr:TolC family protein [Verrucomicrobiota bacterium]